MLLMTDDPINQKKKIPTKSNLVNKHYVSLKIICDEFLILLRRPFLLSSGHDIEYSKRVVFIENAIRNVKIRMHLEYLLHYWQYCLATRKKCNTRSQIIIYAIKQLTENKCRLPNWS